MALMMALRVILIIILIKIASYVRVNKNISSPKMKTHVCNNIMLSLKNSALKTTGQNCTVDDITHRGEQIRATVTLQINHSFNASMESLTFKEKLRSILNTTKFIKPACLMVDNKTGFQFVKRNICLKSVETATPVNSPQKIHEAKNLHPGISTATDMKKRDPVVFRTLQKDICTHLTDEIVLIRSMPIVIVNCSLDQFSDNPLLVKLALVPPPAHRRGFIKTILDQPNDRKEYKIPNHELGGRTMTSALIPVIEINYTAVSQGRNKSYSTLWYRNIQPLKVQMFLLLASVTVVSYIL